MIATEQPSTANATELSVRAIELMSYVRGHKSIFRPGEGFTSVSATLFRKNDTGRSFTPLDELATNASMLPAGDVAAYMVVNSDALIDTAFDAAVAVMPAIADDATLTDILRHDLTALLRTISYGAAAGTVDFIHDNNIGMMAMLHKEVDIADNVFPTALHSARDSVAAALSDPTMIDAAVTSFDTAVDALAI